MKARYRLIRRGIRGGAFYCVDTKTCKRASLGTSDADAAQQIIEAKNNAERQPVLNLQIAKAYNTPDLCRSPMTYGGLFEEYFRVTCRSIVKRLNIHQHAPVRCH